MSFPSETFTRIGLELEFPRVSCWGKLDISHSPGMWGKVLAAQNPGDVIVEASERIQDDESDNDQSQTIVNLLAHSAIEHDFLQVAEHSSGSEIQQKNQSRMFGSVWEPQHARHVHQVHEPRDLRVDSKLQAHQVVNDVIGAEVFFPDFRWLDDDLLGFRVYVAGEEEHGRATCFQRRQHIRVEEEECIVLVLFFVVCSRIVNLKLPQKI